MRAFCIMPLLVVACHGDDTIFPNDGRFGTMHGPSPAIEVICETEDGSDCGSIEGLERDGTRSDLRIIEVNEGERTNGDPMVRNGDHLWLHAQGDEFTAIWAPDCPFTMGMYGQLDWSDPAYCSNVLPAEWTCLRMLK